MVTGMVTGRPGPSQVLLKLVCPNGMPHSCNDQCVHGPANWVIQVDTHWCQACGAYQKMRKV